MCLIWAAVTLDLVQQPDGSHAGIMKIDGAPWTVRNWRRTAAGRVACEARPEGGAALDAWLAALLGDAP